MQDVIQEILKGHRWFVNGEVMKAVAQLFQDNQSHFNGAQQEGMRANELQSQVAYLQEVIAEERQKNDKLVKTISKMDNDMNSLADLQRENEGLKKVVKFLQDSNRKLNSHNEELQREAQEQLERPANYQDKRTIMDLQEEVQKLKDEIDRLEIDNECLSNELDEAGKCMQQLHAIKQILE